MKSLLLQTLTILGLLCLSMQGNAQNRYVDNYQGAWYLGINGGAAWQQSDVKANLGWGAGLTLGRNIYHKPGGLIDFDLRARYLHTRTFGQDLKPSSGILFNSAVNGAAPDAPDYANSLGYAFLNHRTKINELGIEAVITANRLRENTGILLAGYGGANVDFHKTTVDQLDENNALYAYDNISLEGGNGVIRTQLNAMRDGDYETVADGYGKNAKASFMPAAGVELGYQVTPNFAIGIGHKITWTLDDYIDGQKYNTNDNALSDNNDCYHYTNLFLRWRIKGRANTYQDSETIYNENPSTPTNPTTSSGPAPVITITNPRGNPYNSTKPSVNFLAQVKNVKSRSDIRITLNDKPVSFNFNEGKGSLGFVAYLESGRNTVEIFASNQYGSDTKGKTITYQYNPSPSNPTPTTPTTPTYPTPPPNNPTPPVVKKPNVRIVYPSANPHQVTSSTAKVQATITNITKKSQISFTVNGRSSNSFTFNPSTRSFVANLNLAQGNTQVVVSAANQAGSDRDTRTIIYKTTPTPTPTYKPTVMITQPSTKSTTKNTAVVKAAIKHVSSKNDLTFTVNGVRNTSFNYSVSSGQFTATVSLIKGANTFKITGKNRAGTASDSRSIVYTTGLSVKPTVTINTPRRNPYDSQTATTALQATLTGVTKKSEIGVIINGSNFTNFNYNAGTNAITATIALVAGTTNVTVKATNTAGTAKDDTRITYHPQVEVKPTVKITVPTADPHYTKLKSQAVKAVIKNIKEKRQVSLTVNGSALTNFSFNAANGVLTATVPITKGKNKVIVTATNGAGSANDTHDIIQEIPEPKPTVTITAPTANPFSTTATSVNIKAKVTNVASMNQIVFLVNNRPVTTFLYNPKTDLFSATINIGVGSTPVKITATNNAGSASDNALIVKRRAAGEAPRVTITNPASTPFTLNTNNFQLAATVLNVSQKSQIAVLLNGRAVRGFTFNASTHQVRSNLTLNAGNNTVVVRGSNNDGIDTKQAVLIFQTNTIEDPRGPEVIHIPTPTPTTPTPGVPIPTFPTPGGGGKTAKPTVAISSPATDLFSASASYSVRASVSNIDKKGVKVMVNGKAITNFTMDPRTATLVAKVPLTVGRNQVLIQATNSLGAASASVLIGYSPEKSKPVIIPAEGGKGANFSRGSTKQIKVFVANVVSKNIITVKVNGKVTDFIFSPRSKLLSVTAALKQGTNTVEIQAGLVKKVISVNRR